MFHKNYFIDIISDPFFGIELFIAKKYFEFKSYYYDESFEFKVNEGDIIEIAIYKHIHQYIIEGYCFNLHEYVLIDEYFESLREYNLRKLFI